jgi:hypothetical protein
MGKRFLLSFFLVALVPAWVLAAGKTIRQYGIGNSLTGLVNFNEYTQLAASRGNTAVWGLHMKPGGTLDYIYQHPVTGDTFTQPPYGNWVNALNNYNWDVVTLEPFSRPLDGPTGDRANVLNFINQIKPHNPSAQVYIYQTWPIFEENTLNYHDWWLSTYNGTDDRTCRSRDFFKRILADVSIASPMRKRVKMLPVGEVMFQLNERMHAGLIPGYSDISAFYADGIHLNSLGSYTAAVTWYATIFSEDPRGLPTEGYGKIDSALALQIQDTAWKIVKDPRVQKFDPVYSTMLRNVPEPSIAMLAMILLGVTRRRRGRRIVASA